MNYERQFSEAVTGSIGSDVLLKWCRTPESRLCWPGAADVRSQGAVNYFSLNMQVGGGPAHKGVMEEYVGAIHETEAGEQEFASMLTLTWPSGDVGSGEATYRFTPGNGNSTLNFTMSYVLPKNLGVGRMNRDRFLAAVDRALSLYVTRLAHGPQTAR